MGGVVGGEFELRKGLWLVGSPGLRSETWGTRLQVLVKVGWFEGYGPGLQNLHRCLRGELYCSRLRETERFGGGGGDLTAQGGDAGGAFDVDGVGEEDDVGVGGGVEPERGAGEAGVAEGAGVAGVAVAAGGDREESAAGAGIGGVDVPAEAALRYAGGGLAVGGEDGGGADGGGWGLRAGGLLEC